METFYGYSLIAIGTVILFYSLITYRKLNYVLCKRVNTILNQDMFFSFQLGANILKSCLFFAVGASNIFGKLEVVVVVSFIAMMLFSITDNLLLNISNKKEYIE